MSIVTENLVKTYGRQVAVDHLSIQINSGEIVGFLGPNGAGKSTTMKMLTGFIQPDSGMAKVAGFDVVSQGLESRKRIGYLPESNALYTEMYVVEYLGFIASLHKLDSIRSRVDDIIEKTGLTPERHKKIHQLSKGYKQRVGLAQAMIHDPEVLILDEPTSGLDPNQIVEIRELIRSFGQNRTVLLSTHIMQEVKAMCNRVMIINKGVLVADGTPDELQKHLTGRQKIIVQFKNALDQNSILSLAPDIILHAIESNKFSIECDDSFPLKEKLFELAVQTGNVVLEQTEVEQNLETVFQQLTNPHD